ncbi:hypothetical protein LUZ60_002301 [Juncus effusus]|nr:hypothetical protein LUZ60_002301 [Juncus effusus]
MVKYLKPSPLHIVMLPWLKFSHINPFFELSKRISQLSHNITFLSTQPPIDKLLDSIEQTDKFPMIRLIPLDDHDLDSLRESFQKFLEHASLTPDWLIHDFFPDIFISTAAQFDIKCAPLSLIGAAANAFMWSAVFEPVDPKLDQLTKPHNWDPSRISLVYKPYEARQKQEQQMLYNGSTKRKSDQYFMSFGSEDFLTQDYVHELANGLELSGVPFLFALRSPAGGKPFELPEGFEERTSNRGVVCKGWVPQIEILSHPSVGGFLTHCRWSSLVETFQFGQTLIPFPFAHDQCFNSRLIVEKGIGIEIPRNENDGSFSSVDVAKTIRLMMVEEEGKKIREKAKELKREIGREELHGQYVKNFVKYLEENRGLKNKL